MKGSIYPPSLASLGKKSRFHRQKLPQPSLKKHKKNIIPFKTSQIPEGYRICFQAFGGLFFYPPRPAARMEPVIFYPGCHSRG